MSIWALLYRMKKITAGALTEEEALKICGPRP